jgi:hypothetical protein
MNRRLVRTLLVVLAVVAVIGLAHHLAGFDVLAFLRRLHGE